MSIFEALCDAVTDELKAAPAIAALVRQNVIAPSPQMTGAVIDVLHGQSSPRVNCAQSRDWATHIVIRITGRKQSTDRSAAHAIAPVRDAVIARLSAANPSFASRIASLGVMAINLSEGDGAWRIDFEQTDEQIAVGELVQVFYHRTVGDTLTPWN